MFKQDLKEWKAIEREFAAKLLKWDILDIMFSEGKEPWWDIRVCFNKNWEHEWKEFEVKHDKKAEETWNVGFEYMFNWEPSWIYASTADYVVYKVWDKFYYADRIKLIIELSKLHKSDVCGWDNDLSQMFLIPRDVFNMIMKEL